MNNLEEKIAGRTVLVLMIEGVNPEDECETLVQLGKPASAVIHLEGQGSMQGPAIRLTREQAFGLAMKMMELAAPLEGIT